MTSSLRDVEQCNDVMLVLDEIKIVCGVVYNASDDSIVGYAQDMTTCLPIPTRPTLLPPT